MEYTVKLSSDEARSIEKELERACAAEELLWEVIHGLEASASNAAGPPASAVLLLEAQCLLLMYRAAIGTLGDYLRHVAVRSGDAG